MKRITYSKSAVRTLSRMPGHAAALIRSKIELYAANPAALANNVAKLQGRAGYCLRVNDWRVIFDEDGTVLAILDVGPRGGVYN